MKSKSHYCVCLALVVCMTCLVGCGTPEATGPASTVDQHNHDSHSHTSSKSLDELVAKVEELSVTIQDAFNAGDPDKGHGPLHEIGHLLAELPAAAANESLPAAKREQLKQAVDSLMDSFGALDEQLHGGSEEGKSFDNVSAGIEEAMAKLKSAHKEEPAS